MQILIFSDIHGDFDNLKQIFNLDADKYIFLGDLIAFGPDSRKCVELAMKKSKIDLNKKEDEKKFIFLKGNWDAIIAGETYPNPDLADKYTALHLINAILDFYSKKDVLKCLKSKFGKSTTLEKITKNPSFINNFNDDDFIKNFFAGKIELLPELLYKKTPNNSYINWLRSLRLEFRLNSLKIAFAHGGLFVSKDMFNSNYHMIIDSEEKARDQLEWAKINIEMEHIIHGHTHSASIIYKGQYKHEIDWEIPLSIDDVDYISLPPAGKYIKKQENLKTAYLMLDTDNKTIILKNIKE
ncbi:MAG: metallophosphoesterase family protein [Promethearchaeota archaeon]